MDPMETFGVVSGWLHGAGTSASSVFAPMLPRHPGLKGRLDRVNALKMWFLIFRVDVYIQ
ncbi:hypothetical protein SCLCIDRAFT_20591 [Scleroderma citrinum Foug A]|uniref:Uncharacterized protein n=1 Tax=Scleroderma citrinum Foug A TaxID=1036808 RepID=A0A0C3EJV9_9AGAM|nr:hypothetical protein SCLCIDRAFT_20591 [Scleroderma citrinum Foug A]